MAKIKPTLTLVSNANTATTDPGPLSFGLNLSAKPINNVLFTDTVESTVHIITTTAADHLIFDGSAFVGSGVGGTDGGYIYLKNISISGSLLIYIGVGVPAGTTPTLSTATPSTGTATIRTMTLARGEFAFFPCDYIGDITAQASANGTAGTDQPLLECWRFDRHTS